MKIAICDDEENILEKVKRYSEEVARLIGIELNIALFQNVGSLKYEIDCGMQYDLMFMEDVMVSCVKIKIL